MTEPTESFEQKVHDWFRHLFLSLHLIHDTVKMADAPALPDPPHMAPVAPVAAPPAPEKTWEAISPSAAVSRYLAVPPIMLDLYNVRWLLSLSPAERFAWGQQAAKCFPIPPAPADLASNATWNPANNSVDDITGITEQAQTFLTELSQGYDHVGQWRWVQA